MELNNPQHTFLFFYLANYCYAIIKNDISLLLFSFRLNKNKICTLSWFSNYNDKGLSSWLSVVYDFEVAFNNLGHKIIVRIYANFN